MAGSSLEETLLPHPDIDEVVPLSEADADCIRELREVLARHDALQRFGVMLLHKHFDLQSDEILVESVDKTNRRLIMEPVSMHLIDPGESIETSWRLDTQTTMQRCESMCTKPYGPNGPHVRQHFATG